MNKKVLIVLGLCVLATLAVAGYYAFTYYQSKPAIDTESGRGVITTTKKIDFQVSGKIVKVNDFLSYPVREFENVYYLYDGLDFGIIYFAEEKRFYLPIFEQPVKETSLRAEKKFLEVLGVTSEQACMFPIVINGHYSIDPQFEDDREYQLSFCPGDHLL